MSSTVRAVRQIPSIHPRFWTLPFIREKGAGLAVSGGADSIALAYLCKNGAPPEISKKLVAFVVDHGLRAGSDAEAEAVKSQLENQLGIETQILKSETNDKTASPTRLETLAREARYRVLGKACATRGLPYLFLGHHSDDLYETALFRLAGKARFKLGMEEGPGDIPECFGLYGVHRSGVPTTIHSDSGGVNILEFEDGGVKVARPLLSLQKDSLVNLCQDRGLTWVEDPTNKVATLTFRNAIRSNLTPDVLPAALQKDSILKLVQRSRETLREHTEAAEWLYKKTSFKYDPYIGRLAVILPSRTAIAKVTDNEPGDLLLVLSLFVRRLAEFVSPLEGVPLSQASKAARVMFEIDQDIGSPETCNAGGVIFQKRSGGDLDANDHTVWILKRQAIPRGDIQRGNVRRSDSLSSRLFIDIPRQDESTVRSDQQRKAHEDPLPGSSQTEESATAASDFIPRPEDFKLWDNRFWIAVSNPTRYNLRIEPLTKAHLSGFGQLMRNDQVSLRFSDRRAKGRRLNSFRTFLKIIGGLRPGSSAEAIPVLTCSDFDSAPTGGSRILAFPTLELHVIAGPKCKAGLVPPWANDVQWVVHYRRPDCSAQHLGRVLCSDGKFETFGMSLKSVESKSFQGMTKAKPRVRPVRMFDRPVSPLLVKRRR